MRPKFHSLSRTKADQRLTPNSGDRSLVLRGFKVTRITGPEELKSTVDGMTE